MALSKTDTLFLTIAEFIPRKRHRDRLLALKQLNRPEVHLAFAGDGAIREEIEQFAQKLGLQQQVHFLGFRRDIPALICASTALLLTSAREGLPRSIMEAFCAATPVIGANIRGIQDLLADECGLLVDVGDYQALAAAMARIIDSPQLTASMGQNGRQKVANYDVRQIIKLYAEIYDRALGKL